MKPTTKPMRSSEQQSEENAVRREHSSHPIQERPSGTINQKSFSSILSLMASYKRIREEQGLDLEEVSATMGIEASQLLKLETGKMLNPTLATLFNWAEALGQQLEIALTA